MGWKRMNTPIKIEEFGIVIDLHNEGFCKGYTVGTVLKGKIQSTMHKEALPDIENLPPFSPKMYNDEITARAFYNAMIDAIEAMILTHAIEGIDITEEKYINGIRAAIETAEKECKG